MGPATTLHMLLGAVLGWAILSPLAKTRSWAPGPVGDWETGSKGWIVWISLSIMLADSIVSLCWVTGQPLYHWTYQYGGEIVTRVRRKKWREIFKISKAKGQYTPGLPSDSSSSLAPSITNASEHPHIKHRLSTLSDLTRTVSTPMEGPDKDAPSDQLVSTTTVLVGLTLSIMLCVITVHFVFYSLMPLPLTILSLPLALVLSVIGVRALGETDLNPVSGISKITQLIFAAITYHKPHAVLINLIAGALSEAGAQQAGDLMQDLKTGHLLGASPKAQFKGQLIGSAVGAIVSAAVYRLYTHVYEVPGDLFQVPTAFVWVFTARLVLGKGLPPMVGIWATGVGVIWLILSILRTTGRARGSSWVNYVPGGIAVAVGKSRFALEIPNTQQDIR
jgi:OPT family oligopeptide transporter